MNPGVHVHVQKPAPYRFAATKTPPRAESVSAQPVRSRAAWLLLLLLLCVCVNHYLPCLQLNGMSRQWGLCDAGGGGREGERSGEGCPEMLNMSG